MQHTILSRLNDILRAIDGATATLGNADFETFQSRITSLERSNAVWKSSPKRRPTSPDEVKARYPDIPWPQIAGIGNILRHSYDRVDDHILWEIATVHFADLRRAVVEIRSGLSA